MRTYTIKVCPKCKTDKIDSYINNLQYVPQEDKWDCENGHDFKEPLEIEVREVEE